jgi:hypothetical protein
MTVPAYISDVMFNMDHGTDNDPKFEENAEMLSRAMEEAVEFFGRNGRIPTVAELMADFEDRI